MRKDIFRMILVGMLLSTTLVGCNNDDGKDDNVSKRESVKKNKDKDKDKKKDKKKSSKKVDIDELKTSGEIMFEIREVNWGEVCTTDDYWDETVYSIYYDGTLYIQDVYNLSDSEFGSIELSDEDYKDIYLAGLDGFENDAYADYDEDGCDGVGWHFTFTNTDGESKEIYSGYLYGENGLSVIVRALQDYKTDVVMSPVEGSGENSIYNIEEGSWQECYYNYLINIKYDRDLMYDSEDIFDVDEEYPNYYYLYDFTDDGIPELVIKYGSCEADYEDRVYTFVGDKVPEYLGFIYSGHSSFYSNPDGGIIRHLAHMGEGFMEAVVYEDGEFTWEKIYEESGYDENGNWDSDFEYTDVEQIVDGAEYIEYNELEDFIPIYFY